MANTSRVQGLRPISQPYGAIRVNWYEAATGVAYYRYQPVDLDSNGRIVAAVHGSGNFLVGSVIAFGNSDYGPPEATVSGYMPANPTVDANSAGLINILVADDPNQFFVLEEDTGGAALDAQAVGLGCSWVFRATTGNTKTGLANVVLDRSTAVVGSNQQLRIIRKQDKPDNAFGNYCKWIVKPYYHRYNSPNMETALGTTV